MAEGARLVRGPVRPGGVKKANRLVVAAKRAAGPRGLEARALEQLCLRLECAPQRRGPHLAAFLRDALSRMGPGGKIASLYVEKAQTLKRARLGSRGSVKPILRRRYRYAALVLPARPSEV